MCIYIRLSQQLYKCVCVCVCVCVFVCVFVCVCLSMYTERERENLLPLQVLFKKKKRECVSYFLE
jgi:hypothetical protein